MQQLLCTLNRRRRPGGMREQVRVCGRESAVGTATGSEAVPRRECRVGRKTRKWLARDGVRVRDERRRPARTSGPRALVGLACGRVCKSARVSTCCLPLKGRSFVVRLNGIFLERPELVCIVGTLFHMYKQRHQPETKITTNHFRPRDENSRK